MRPSRAVASFDSATGMLRALSRFLGDGDVAMLGVLPAALEPPMYRVARAVNRVPVRVREQVYSWSGWTEAIRPRRAGDVRSEEIAEWVVGHYRDASVPAVFVGSSNGALAHLAAAMRAPWLPQTLLIPVRRHGVHPDEPQDDLAAALEPGRALLDANPDLVPHHMNDANQDRLMIRHMTYFRVKWRRLPSAYKRFVTSVLRPGGTIFIIDCRLRWPTTKVGERHLFQHGALGGATIEEFHHGGARVADYLARYGSHRRRWEPPALDGESPEAEWGLDEELCDDIYSLADKRGHRVRRISFDEPEDASPPVADLHRWWYGRLGLPTGRLLVESFLLIEPYWALRTASVPFWMVFNMQPSLRALHSYLDAADGFDEIRLALFSHGVESVGLAGIDQWEGALRRARKLGVFVGVDPGAFPRDFADAVSFHRDLARIRSRYPLPPTLSIDELDDFVATSGSRYRVTWS